MDAIQCLKDYKHWGILNENTYKVLTEKIKSAKTNDEISEIMRKVRCELL